jgi:hypothetical protein
MRGGLKWAKPACGRPLDGRVSPHAADDETVALIHGEPARRICRFRQLIPRRDKVEAECSTFGDFPYANRQGLRRVRKRVIGESNVVLKPRLQVLGVFGSNEQDLALSTP